MGIILEASHLTYGYDESSHAIEDLSIAFEEGKTTAILGANGAGKSTLFLHLNGILQPEQGEVRFRGQPISYKKAGLRQLRSKVGIVFQNPDDQLFSASVYQDISFGAVNMGLPAEEVHRRVETVMEQVGITYLKDRPTHALSFGQKKRVAFAGIMVMQPEVIILDEPTVGLDPAQVIEIRNLIRELGKAHTVILSSHILSEVQAVCQQVLILSKGHLVAVGSPEELGETLNPGSRLRATAQGETDTVLAAVRSVPGICKVELESAADGQVTFTAESEDAADRRAAVSRALTEAGCTVLALAAENRSLEEVFLALTEKTPEQNIPAEGEEN